MMLVIYLTPETKSRLHQLSHELGRSMEDLAESAVSESVLDAFRTRNDDPAKPPAL